jgi:DNA primase
MGITLTPPFVQAVREATDLVDLVSEHTRLEKRGHRLLGLCPFHKEKTPSFSVDAQSGLYYCFGCGAGGDAIKFHMQTTGDDFGACMEALAGRYGIPLPSTGRAGGEAPSTSSALAAAEQFFREQLRHNAGARQYLERRRTAPELVQDFGLGYAPDQWRALIDTLARELPLSALEAAGLISRSDSSDRPYDRFRHRLMFPIRGPSGRLLGFGGRTLGDDNAKYINTKETAEFQKGTLLYGLDRARAPIREKGVALLVEGYFDVLGAVQSGIPNVVASMGTALTAPQVRLLARYADEVVVGYDGDRAGEEASLKALPLLLAAGLVVRRARFPAGQDPDSLRVEEGPEVVRELVEQAPDFVILQLERIPINVRDDPRRVAAAASELRPILAAVRDATLRAAYERAAAEKLGAQVGVSGGGGIELLRRPAARGTTTSASPGRGLEVRVLTLLLQLGAPWQLELPDEGVFWDDDTRAIFVSIRAAGRSAGRTPELLSRVMANLDPAGDAVGLLASLQADLPQSPIDSAGEELAQHLDRLVYRNRRRRLQQLASEIQHAQRTGDRQRLHVLLEEKASLSRIVHRSTRSEEAGS